MRITVCMPPCWRQLWPEGRMLSGCLSSPFLWMRYLRTTEMEFLQKQNVHLASRMKLFDFVGLWSRLLWSIFSPVRSHWRFQEVPAICGWTQPFTHASEHRQWRENRRIDGVKSLERLNRPSGKSYPDVWPHFVRNKNVFRNRIASTQIVFISFALSLLKHHVGAAYYTLCT